MLSWVHLAGFLIGAALGMIATAATGEQIHYESQRAFSEARWKKFRDRPNLLWAATRLLHIEAIIFVIGLWVLIVTILGFCASADDERGFIIGSVIGVIAAPWVWLHYARRLSRPAAGTAASPSEVTKSVAAANTSSTSAEVPDKEGPIAPDQGGPGESLVATSSLGDFDRYRLLTIMLGIAILIVALLPFLGKWLNTANKVEAFGFSLTLNAANTERGARLLPSNRPNFESTSGADRLEQTTLMADNIERGDRALDNIGPDLQGFTDLSSIDRERAYIAFLTYTRLAELENRMPETNQNLDEYIRGEQNLETYIITAQRALRSRWPIDLSIANIYTDSWFLSELQPLPRCLYWYQHTLKDYHLFTLDVGPFLRSLAVALRQGVSGNVHTGTGPAVGPPSLSPTNSEFLPFDFHHVRVAATNLALQITDLLQPANSGGDCDSVTEVTGHFNLAPDPGYPDVEKLIHLGTTPYPAMMLAYYMAAIDSVESGVVMLNEWVKEYHNKFKDLRLELHPQLGWYEVRAMLAASQLPFFFGGLTPTHRALVRYQQQTTDRMAALFDVATPDAWQRFCRRLAPRTLHTQLGRLLAFLYVNERFYLFELLVPEDFANSGKDDGLASTDVTPDRFIEEADAVLKDPGCLAGVPGFERFREQYIGMFHLYAAQLRVASYERASGSERVALRAKISSEIELAKSLGSSPVSDKGEPDLLEQADEFDRHRTRLIQLQEWLKKNASDS